MGRNNVINGRMSFAGITGKDNDIPSYETFLGMDSELGITETNELKEAKELYLRHLNVIKKNVEVLSQIEELISQIRSREMIPSEMKLSICKDYVYARSTFYRRRYEPNDIRVFLGRTDIVGGDIEVLMNSPQFMNTAHEELKKLMSTEILGTKVNLNKILYEKEFTRS